MKKCLKCGAKFEDRFGFCPECGEKLVPSNECPNCHLELAPNAKFCPNCGTRIGEQPQPEPQPEPMPAPAPQAAPQPQPAPQPMPAPQPQPAPAPQQPYGQPYPQQGYYGYQQPATQPKPQRQKNPNVMRLVSNFVYMGMFILAALFYIIGLFGAPFTYAGYGYDVSFTYFFQYDQFGSVGAGVPFVVLDFLFYYLAIVGFIIVLAMGIPSVIKAFKVKDQPINSKPLMFVVMFLLPHFIYMAFFSKYPLSLGWGSVLLLVSLILAILGIAALKVLGGELKAKPIVANSLNGSAFLFAVLAASFGVIAGANSFMNMIADPSYIEYYIKNGGQFFFALALMLFALTGAIFAYVAAPKTAGREKGIKKAVVLLSLFAGFTTIGFVFAVILMKNNLGPILPSFIEMWIFFIFAVGLLVAASKLDPKKPAAPQQAYRPQQPYGQPYQPQPQPQQPYQQQYRPQPQPQPQQQPQQRPMDNNNPYRY